MFIFRQNNADRSLRLRLDDGWWMDWWMGGWVGEPPAKTMMKMGKIGKI